LKVLHITPSFYPAANFGGPVYSGYRLCNALAQIEGVELRVLTTNGDGPTGKDTFKVTRLPVILPEGYEVFYCPQRLALTFSPEMFLRLYPMIKWADIVHLTSVYSPPTIPTLLICKTINKPLVWSTRGMLQYWHGTTRKKVKRVWESICNHLCDEGRVVMHVTSEEESTDNLKRISRATTTIIPNGIEIPHVSNSRVWQPEGKTRLLFVGRLNPIKGVENILKAFAKLDNRITLAICGDGDTGYKESLKHLVNALSLQDRVKFYGNVAGEEKQARYDEADICVVPSHKENFCLVVAESLAQGVPVIASRGTPWSRMETIGCGMWVENDPANLAEAVKKISKMPLHEMGQRGRAWIEKEFSWEEQAEKMLLVYSRLLTPAERGSSNHEPIEQE